MADTIYNNKLDLPVSIRRTNNVPLDDASVFETVEDANAYITPPGGASNSTAYVGQIIYVKDQDAYYSIVLNEDNNSVGLKIIPNTQSIRTIDKSKEPGNNNIQAAVKFNVIDNATPDEREIAFDSNTKELKIGLPSGTQTLSPSWNGSDATFRGDVKAKTFTIEDTTTNNEITLHEEDFKLINSLTAYDVSEFTVEVFDTNETKIEDLKFNFRDGTTWTDWALANTSSGFRCVRINNAANESYIRYKNSYLVYTREQQATEGPGTEIVVTEVEPNDKIVASASKTYYCSPAEATGPITNVTFDADTGDLHWTNPPSGGLCQGIGGIRILYRTDRYPENESDLMYKFSDDGEYVQEGPEKTGCADLNSSEHIVDQETRECKINILELFKDLQSGTLYLQSGTLYYFYVAPCTSNGFYTESKHQRCLVYIPEKETAASLDDPEANTSNSPLETLLGV